jgi:glyoxylase-like metal-dependent hydrolase (beta-lactamase superfamily II)
MTDLGESALHYPFGDTLPESGSTLEVAPGVRWLRMTLPFALNHINLWLLRDTDDTGREGWTIVDCGIANEATREAWERVFSTELQGLPVLRVLVTHMHPDHIGLADWLCERWSRPGDECRLWISATDWNAAHRGSQATTDLGGAPAASFFARHGITDPNALAQVRERTHYYASMVPKVPARYRRLMDGMVLRIGGVEWTCIAGYGHAPEHIALHAPSLGASGVLISGDMVLPRISTNVSVFDLEPEADPLPLFLSSIARMRTLPPATLVLPSHGKPFHGLHERIDQLTHHHGERFEDVLAACATAPQSAADLLPVLFKRTLDLHQTTFAMGESIAHLHALVSQGRLRAEAGADDVLRFRRVD